MVSKSLVELTDEQRGFLIHHKISPLGVFDASGLASREWKPLMKSEEKLFAIGVTPCKRSGHTLRDRANHCIQCDTSNIHHIKSYFKDGYVYVSGSRSLRMLKIGSSSDPIARERTINGHAYGGASDWVKIAHIKCKNAGSVEFEVHSRLKQFLAPQTYLANGRVTRCREIFSCGYKTARRAISDSVGIEQEKYLNEALRALEHFDFADRP